MLYIIIMIYFKELRWGFNQRKINWVINLFFYAEMIVLLHRNRLSDYLKSLTSTVQPLPSVLNSTSFLF